MRRLLLSAGLLGLALHAAACTTPRSPLAGSCVFNADCVAPNVCSNRRCRAPCRTDADCVAGAQCRLDPVAGARVCVPPEEPFTCRYSSDCPPRGGAFQVCSSGLLCVPQCTMDSDCASWGVGLRCQTSTSRCVPGATDGGVDASCPSGQSACGASCVDTQTDPAHCGNCARDCRTLPGVQADRVRCAVGACVLEGACATGRAHCSNVADDGCEADLSEPTHCGACGTRCSGATPYCARASGDGGSWACSDRCSAGQTACNGLCVDTQTDPAHCGACGQACVARPHSVASCAAGSCAQRCEEGFGDCDGDASNGCETDLRTDAAHCGTCATACASAHATPVCTASACGPGVCDVGFGDCDGNPGNGCETDLSASDSNCGACGASCARAHGAGRCARGACGALRCDAGFGDCDGDASNGCETDLSTSASNCGRCGSVCSGAGATGTCASGACTLSCTAGRADCDGMASTGCEVDTRTSAANCGACGRACTAAHGTASCAAGACGLAACDAGYGDCDGDASNGCETNLATSGAHCGRCMSACMSTNAASSCVAGACTRGTCAAGYGDCDGDASNGCETNLATSTSNCGSCGRACGSVANGTASCSAGACVIASCAALFGDCNRLYGDGCEADTSSDRSNCGGCGAACTFANASGLCSSGSCLLASCNAGYQDCDGMGSNGCEANLLTDSRNCGACGTVCASPPDSTTGQSACVGGGCALAPSAGFACTGSVCDVAPPTQTAPPSASYYTSRRPLFQWRLAAGTDGARLEVATGRDFVSDASMGTVNVVYSADVTGTSHTPTADLPAGRLYWRLRGTRMGRVGSASLASPVWALRTARATPPGGVGTFWNARDVDGDGVADFGRFAAYSGLSISDALLQVFYGHRPTPDRAPGALLYVYSTIPNDARLLGDTDGDGLLNLGVRYNPTRLSEFAVDRQGRVGAPHDLTLTGAPTATRGTRDTLAALGDVTGDGYGDVLVMAAPGYTVYLFQGSSTGLRATPTQTLTGTNGFGSPMVPVGDLNADGYPDVVIGSCYGGNPGTQCTQRAYVYLGSPTGLQPATPSVIDRSPTGGFSYFVAPAGDVNSDGFADVFIGDTSTGQVFLGGATGLTATTVSITRAGFTDSVAGGCDLDGDGNDDLVLAGGGNPVDVFFGNGVTLSATKRYRGPSSRSLAALCAGDLDGDGRDDLVLSENSAINVFRWPGVVDATGQTPAPTITTFSSVGTTQQLSVRPPPPARRNAPPASRSSRGGDA